MFVWVDYADRMHWATHEIVTIRNGEEHREFHELNEKEVQKVIDDYVAEGAKEVTNKNNIITAIF